MKYKFLNTDDEWLLQDGGIRLYKEDSERKGFMATGDLKRCTTFCNVEL